MATIGHPYNFMMCTEASVRGVQLNKFVVKNPVKCDRIFHNKFIKIGFNMRINEMKSISKVSGGWGVLSFRKKNNKRNKI